MENPRVTVRRMLEQQLGRLHADLRQHRAGVEEQLLSLRRDRLRNARVRMAGDGDRMTTIEVEIAFSRGVVEVAPLSPNGHERQAGVNRQLGRVRARGKTVGGAHGMRAGSLSPVVSGRPKPRFMHWTAWPDAPRTRLSTEDITSVTPSVSWMKR